MRFSVRILTVLIGLVTLIAAGCSSKQDYPVRTYALGQQIQLGGLSYTAYESHWLTQLGQPPAARIPEHRYFTLKLDIRNTGTTNLIVPPMSVTDANGKAYSELSDGTSVPAWLGLLREVKAGASIQGNVVFDCPPAHYQLHIADENESLRALVDIPLTYTLETPEIASPAVAEKK